MSLDHVRHADIGRFADQKVNLKRDDAAELRAQTNRLRERLDQYLKEHPDFDLRRMMLSGSLAKGTALKSLNDVDVACYVSSDHAPHKIGELVVWLADRLRKAFPNFKPEQVKPQTYSVTVSFQGSGLDIDVVPILYRGDPEWRGDLVSQETGETLMTSIPMHLDFIRKRKTENQTHFAQVVRLVKFWAKLRKQENSDFRFKSFMIELILAHLADHGKINLANYPEAMADLFTYLAVKGMGEVVAFSDYYNPAICRKTSNPVHIWDPVNPENNVSSLYTEANRLAIIDAAIDAGDAVDAALRAPTKAETLRYWRRVFGSNFDV